MVLEIGGVPTIDNTVQQYYLYTDGGVCASMHMLVGLRGYSPRIKIRCSEITSEAIFVLKFIFGFDAARILCVRVLLEHCSPCYIHGSQSLVVTCRGYQCQMCALQSIGAKQQNFKTEVN